MFDGLTQKMIETIFSSYMPTIQRLSEERVHELENMKLKIRTAPTIVEEWFDEEIQKAQNIDSERFLRMMGKK